MKRPHVHVLGNTVVDVFVRNATLGAEGTDAWAGNVCLLDEPVEAVLGGCGAAPAYLLGRLGARVRLTSSIGHDAWGATARGWLQAAGVEICAGDAASTAVNVILLDPSGGRRALYYTGSRVPWETPLTGPAPAWVLLSGYGGADTADLGAMVRTARRCAATGTRVAFDPGPWLAGRVARQDMLALWAVSDCLIATAAELRAWVSAGDPEALAAAALAAGAAAVVVKLGAAGALHVAGGQAPGRVTVAAVERGNSVGAGDAFDARLVYGLASGESLAAATDAAATMATAVVRAGRGVLGVT